MNLLKFLYEMYWGFFTWTVGLEGRGPPRTCLEVLEAEASMHDTSRSQGTEDSGNNASRSGGRGTQRTAPRGPRGRGLVHGASRSWVGASRMVPLGSEGRGLNCRILAFGLTLVNIRGSVSRIGIPRSPLDLGYYISFR